MMTLKPIFILYLFLFTISACKNNNITPDKPQSAGTGTLSFHLHNNIDGTAVGYGDTALDAGGRKIVLSLAQFYISGITARKTDGSTFTFNGVYLLKKMENDVYAIGSGIPAGDYTSVSFNIGVDSVANSKSPSSYNDSNNVLSTQFPAMWFGSISQGYIFMNVQGTVDTSAGTNGIANFPFQYKIGSNTLLKNIFLPRQTFTITAGQVMFMHIICDYGILLQGLDFKTQHHTDTYTANPSLAIQIANNIPLMFRYEQ